MQRYNDPDIDKLLSICSFVDPRFKKRIPEDARIFAINAVKKELMEDPESSYPDSIHCENELVPPLPKKSALSRILGDNQAEETDKSTSERN